jgi:hypothetical protein
MTCGRVRLPRMKGVNIRSRCPNCGKQALIHMRYGYPGAVLMHHADQGLVALGGCVITGDDPRYRCQNCRSDIWRDGRFRLPDEFALS